MYFYCDFITFFPNFSVYYIKKTSYDMIYLLLHHMHTVKATNVLTCYEKL